MSSSSTSNDLRNRIIFTIAILAVYRFGTFIPLPGIDPPTFSSFSIADLDAKSASILILSFIFPEPKIFNLTEFLLINLSFLSKSEFRVSLIFILFLSIYD